MKLTRFLLLLVLSAAYLAVATNTASAFYDPNKGRWLSRDPLGDDAFFSEYAKRLNDADYEAADAESRKPEYLFVGNNPTNSYDKLGLLKVYIGKRNINAYGSFLGTLSGLVVKHWFLVAIFDKGDLKCCEYYKGNGGGLVLEAGLGEAGGQIPGQQYELNPFPRTQVVDHRGQGTQSGTELSEASGYHNPCKLYYLMTYRKPSGSHYPFDNCHDWVNQTLQLSSTPFPN